MAKKDIIINISEIKKYIAKAPLRELSKATGIPYRTLQDWRLKKSDWLNTVETRLVAIQKEINKNK